jgi:hypothetical protein
MGELRLYVHVILLAAIAGSGCARSEYSYRGANYETRIAKGAVLRSISLDPATEDGVLALVPERISQREIRDVLSRAPAPRVVILDGSLPLVTMESFSEFLIDMGYPEEKVRKPNGGGYSYNGFTDSKRLAGTVAWYYEKEGMMPMLIGHSQGGMLAIKVLHELAGAFHENIPVWNPLTNEAEERIAIIDPITGQTRAVIGLQVRYAAAITTGKVARILLGQWSMFPKVREIPDTVEEFTGFSLTWDLIAGNFGSAAEYHPLGSATVRNVTLPGEYTHITVPLTRHLAANEVTRGWIDRYVPTSEVPALPSNVDVDTQNILHAAEIWYHVKKYWCLEAQRLIRARRSMMAKDPTTPGVRPQ